MTTVGDTRHYLYINYGGHFREEAVQRNCSMQTSDKRKLSGMTPNVGDYDRDGFVDIYVTEWIPHSLGKVIKRNYLIYLHLLCQLSTKMHKTKNSYVPLKRPLCEREGDDRREREPFPIVHRALTISGLLLLLFLMDCPAGASVEERVTTKRISLLGEGVLASKINLFNLFGFVFVPSAALEKRLRSC